MFAVAVAALGLSSCAETWDDPATLKTHQGTLTANFLNEPVMQNQPIMLTNNNQNGTFHLTCSQPDFGYAAVATYRVQCSLSKEFTTYEEIQQDFYNCAQINPLNADVAGVLEKLAGVKTEDDLPLKYQPLYMRLRAYVAQDEAQTEYLSNVVSFNQVSADYLAIWVAGVPIDMYLRGGMNEWGSPAEYQFMTGPEENTWVTNTITIAANTQFKVADASWGACNWGGPAGANTEIVVDEPFTLNTNPADGGPGNLIMPVDFKGVAHVSQVKGVYTLTMAASK